MVRLSVASNHIASELIEANYILSVSNILWHCTLLTSCVLAFTSSL